MNEQTSNKRKYTRYALGAWVAGLALFMAVLIAALASAPTITAPGEVKKRLLRTRSDAFDPGYIIETLPEEGSVNVPAPEFSADDGYVLIGFGLQGFHQAFPEGLPWSIDLPEKVLEAQLIKRGNMPKVLTQGVKLSWELASESAENPGYIAFTQSSGEMTPNEKNRSFSAAIEATVPLKRAGDFNPYQVIKLKAEDAASGEILAESAAVLAVSPGFGCAHCHAEAEYSIPALHDKANRTELEAQARLGETVYCKSCHMDLAYEDGKYQGGFALSFSAAIHGWHTPFLKDRKGDACLTCHIGLGRQPAEPEEKRAKRPQALFMRGIHLTRGLSCVNCHGYMEDHSLALLQAENEAGQEFAAKSMGRITPHSVKDLAEIKPRMAWVQEPDCTGCHDYRRKPVILEVSGFNRWTAPPDEYGRPTLFSARADYGGVMRCAACHGAPHAIYPARNPVAEDLDNIPPVQYQETAAPVGSGGNCAVCHTKSKKVPPIHHPVVQRSSRLLTLPESADLMMPLVRFSHAAHTPLEDCGTCHHTGHEDGKPLLCSSPGCHDLASEDEAPAGQDYSYFRQAFHGEMPSCNACHEARQRHGKPAGPTDCAGCHRAPSSLWNAE